MLKRIAFTIAVNMGALWVTALLIEKFNFTGGIPFLLIAGVVLGLLNMLVKPVIKLVSFPAIFISAGLFLVVINAAMLWVLNYSLDILDFTGIDLQVEGALTYLWAAIIFGLVNWLEHWILKK